MWSVALDSDIRTTYPFIYRSVIFNNLQPMILEAPLDGPDSTFFTPSPVSRGKRIRNLREFRCRANKGHRRPPAHHQSD
jgi:hypothetical protein